MEPWLCLAGGASDLMSLILRPVICCSCDMSILTFIFAGARPGARAEVLPLPVTHWPGTTAGGPSSGVWSSDVKLLRRRLRLLR